MREEKELIRDRILSYLKKNPDAGSTLEVIASWWMKTEFIDHTVDQVAEVLGELVDDGMVTVYQSRGSKPIYKLCKGDDEVTQFNQVS